MSFISIRLSQVLKKSTKIQCNSLSRFVVMSDCHRGDHSLADNFKHNKVIYEHALDYYYEHGFIYVENGDGDELWENTSFYEIWKNYNNIFDSIYRFHEDNRLYMIYGNHDIVKKFKKFNRSFVRTVAENVAGKKHNKKSPDTLYRTYESLTLLFEDKEQASTIPVFIVHGHQGDIPNDILWRITRFLVRHVWRRLELIGIKDPTSPANSTSKCTRIDRKIKKWCRLHDQITIAGHTHFPQYPLPGQSPYFNDGSCVHPESITAIEIEKNEISLVKWRMGTRKSGDLFVERKLWEGPGKLSDFVSV